MQVLSPNSQIISIESSESQSAFVEVYEGEWIYCSLSKSAALIGSIYNGNDKSNTTILGIIMSENKGHKSKQSIRRQIALIRNNYIFPADITVGEEIANNLSIRNIDADNSIYVPMLKEYDISTDDICYHLSDMSKLLLEIIIAVESDIRILLIDGVISLIGQPYRDRILNYIHRNTISNGLSVIISTDNNELKEQFLGREI